MQYTYSIYLCIILVSFSKGSLPGIDTAGVAAGVDGPEDGGVAEEEVSAREAGHQRADHILHRATQLRSNQRKAQQQQGWGLHDFVVG